MRSSGAEIGSWGQLKKNEQIFKPSLNIEQGLMKEQETQSGGIGMDSQSPEIWSASLK